MILRQYRDMDALPRNLIYYGASDHATLEPQKGKKEPDFSEHGIVGVDTAGDLWFVDWWFGQKESDKVTTEFIRLLRRWKPRKWWTEGGTLDKGIGPFIRKEMRRNRTYVTVDTLPSLENKGVKLQAFHAMASAGAVHFPIKRPWAERVIDQLVKFPSGRFDDAADVCGLIGRGLDKMQNAKLPEEHKRAILVPYTEAWLAYNDVPDKPVERFF